MDLQSVADTLFMLLNTKDDSSVVKRRICLFCGLSMWWNLLGLEQHFIATHKVKKENG